MKGYEALREMLYKRGFSVLCMKDSRRSIISVDGVSCGIKKANMSASGRWRVNIHRHGIIDETDLDAYIFVLSGLNKHATYMVLPAPAGRSCFNLTLASAYRTYGQYINNWELIREILNAKKSAVTAA